MPSVGTIFAYWPIGLLFVFKETKQKAKSIGS
jgi:hypothetical protein